MKSLLLVATLTLSFNAFSSDSLIKLSKNSGFSPVPSSSVLSITETGKASLVSYRGTAVIKTELKDLSPNDIQTIKDNVDTLNAKDKLVDPEAKKPKCTDAPSWQVSVTKNEKDVTIAYNNSCHTTKMKSKAATNLINLILTIDSQR
jgi:hypothetical protein